MNKVLWDAEIVTEDLRQELKELSNRPVNQPTLFELPPSQSKGNKWPRPSIEQIAADIDTRILIFGPLQRRALWAALADEPYFRNEVIQALNLLKKKGRIKEDLQHDAWVISGTA